MAGEKNGRAGGMELRVGDRQCGDVKCLQMWVRVSINLYTFLVLGRFGLMKEVNKDGH
jgi:hypothetical protein